MVSSQVSSTVLLVVLWINQMSSEILNNPDFEDTTLGAWYGIGLNIHLDTQAFSGSQSVKTSGRYARWNGPGQDVALQPGTSYKVGCYVKLLNDSNGVLFQTVFVSGGITWLNGSDSSYIYARKDRLTSNSGWTFLQGAFQTPSEDFQKASVYVQGPQPGIDFLVDKMSLEVLWKAEAYDRIEQYRKSDVTLDIQLAPGLNPHNYELEVKHVNHSFPFGTVVSDSHLLDPTFKPYQDALFGMFNWFTVGTYKWKFSDGTPNNPNYNRSTQTADFLRQNGFPLRGHTMFWASEWNTPDWVKDLSQSEFKTTIENRVRYLTEITTGKIEHWDVNNELLHGAYLEEKTGDPGYSKKLFSMVSQANPNFKLFLNDYGVLAGGSQTQAYVDLAIEFKNANVGLYGLGIQSHFDTNPDPYVIKHRLDLLATTGLPLWISELDLVAENETTRAEWYEKLWTLFYSHPAVEGIVMWDVWGRTQSAGPMASLINGNSYYINVAGQKWLKLVKEVWSTRISYPVSRGNSFKFRGFRGSYDVIVKKNGRPVKAQQFTLGKSSTTVIIAVGGNEQPADILEPPVLPLKVNRQFPHTDHFVSRRTYGVMESGRSAGLRCVNRHSALSPVGDDQRARVSCQSGEVMTSCSMLTEDKSDLRDGETFEYHEGQVVCVGINGFKSAAPVRAQARCCRLTGLTCELTESGPTPTPPKPGDRARTTCSPGRIATGCTSYSYYVRAMDGALHQTTSCIGQIDEYSYPKGGVFCSAFCCSAPQLRCRVIRSAEGGMTKGSKVTSQCTSGEVMLGCSVFSEDGRTAGSRITDDTNPRCEAVSGSERYLGERGVIASAVCCSMR